MTSTPTSERVLAPDLARGFALLLVALAHTASIFLGNAPGVDQTPEGLERPYFVILFVFVHACALPLFGMMLGYGIVQFANRQEALGQPWTRTRGILLRRHAWLLVFGAVDGVLFFSGDVLGAYGVIGVVFTLLLLRRGKGFYRIPVLYLGFGVCYLAVLMYLVLTGGSGSAPVPSVEDVSSLAPTYGDAVRERLTEWPMSTAILLSSILFVWVGAWAAKKRVLEEPNRKLLLFGVFGGFGVAIAGALPMGLFAGDYVGFDEETAALAKLMYEGAGLFGAIGYVSLFGLIGMAVGEKRRGVVVTAISALGQRTLSAYLFQSVAWLILAPPFMLGLAGQTFVAAACGLGVWLVTVVVAYLMHRRSYRGPAEILVRKLAYRTPETVSRKPLSRR
ncbi:DUF418 domain-containing protein [Amycolatopsis roodepoortensis]|uniref:DUF418 domain-containing protein n=1 Tax=Amycolatopsis roodepoortensis TaxID=700274 RepID=UPI00214CBC3F|nr:DUF418 domain-containing protein [Amycolatopsis roodepoortensis]UUV27895.1 DUF418 domain-containing protein [Amycolatopsis roodepoortensis]